MKNNTQTYSLKGFGQTIENGQKWPKNRGKYLKFTNKLYKTDYFKRLSWRLLKFHKHHAMSG